MRGAGGATTLRINRPLCGFTRTMLLIACEDGADPAKTGIASNSIKQKRMVTFLKTCGTLNFDVNILDVVNPAKSVRSAWILVGGRSSRMGTDKACALSDGRALALRVADRIAPVCNCISVVGDPAIYAGLGLPVISDNFPGQGPLAGIEAALAATPSEANLILACDMPALRENLLEDLFAAGGDVAVPRHENGKIEPLCAVFQKSCHPPILAALNAGVRRVTDMLRAPSDGGFFEVRYVRVSDSAAFANLNTPEDWQTYHERQKHRQHTHG